MTKKKTPQTMNKAPALTKLKTGACSMSRMCLSPPKDYKADAGCTRTPWSSPRRSVCGIRTSAAPSTTARKKAEAFAATFEKECREGVTSDSRVKFEEYCEYVLELKERRGAKHSTIVRYRELTTRIYPAIGHMKLRDIRADHLNMLYTANIYAHVMEAADKKNADILADVFLKKA